MTLTQWIGGAEQEIMPISADTKRPIVAATYNIVESEVPIVLPHIYDHFEPVNRTELKHKDGSIIVRLDNTIVEYDETDPQLKRFEISADGTFDGALIRLTYVPGDPDDYYGNGRYETNRIRTNIVRKYIKVNTHVVNQIRAAINQLEATLGYLQSRWIGGVYTDSFANITGDPNDPQNIKSNIIAGQTLYNEIIFEEILISLYDVADKMAYGISKYNEDFIIKNKQLNATWIEAVRSAINDLEEAI